jgi:FkbM family methyltransferase
MSEKNRIHKFLWLLIESLTLDLRTVTRCKAILKRGSFNLIIRKYLIIMKHVFVPFTEGSSMMCDGDRVYYDSRYGIAGYQRILTTHNYLLDLFMIRDIDTVVDVGANVGYFSLMCKKLYTKCTIHAFEPVPDMFRLLKLNIGSSSKVHLYQQACGEISGTEQMLINEINKAESMVSDAGNLTVQVVTLDEVLDKLCSTSPTGLIDLLKVDVETFEQSVLRGASKTLSKTRFLFLEATCGDNSRYTFTSLMSNLVSETYEFQFIGFRNFARKSDGPVEIMEMLFVNRTLENS